MVLESITFPEPVISMAVEPKTKADQEKMGSHYKNLHQKIQHSESIQMKKQPNNYRRNGRAASWISSWTV
jgi:hypothetical protein